MKPALYYTLTGSQWSNNYTVFAVTSEGPRRRINGRFMDGFPSHTTADHCKGRFDKPEDAKAKIAEIETINKKHNDMIEPLNEKINQIERDRTAAIKAILP